MILPGESEISSDQAIQQLINGNSLLDVRSTAEYERSYLPFSVNVPILSNQERAKVGTTYKEQGQEKAISLGHTLVCGEIKEERVRKWLEAINKKRCSALLCARGGLRSKIAAQWVQDQNIHIPRIAGGYRAVRSKLIQELQSAINTFSFVIIGGPTGSAKTYFLNSLAEQLPVIDLEALANHRGSAFGSLEGGQPGQATFENSLAVSFLQHATQSSTVILEDESRLIGRNILPEEMYHKMKTSPRFVLDVALEQRVKNIRNDYIDLYLTQSSDTETTLRSLFKRYTNALSRIRKKLGNERTSTCEKLMQEAFSHSKDQASFLHNEWIEFLLKNYYDPIYEQLLDQNKQSIFFRGEVEKVRSQITKYWEQHTAQNTINT